MSSLSQVPYATRRRMSLVLGTFAVLLLIIGALSVAIPGAAGVSFAVVGLLAAVLLGLMAWGVRHSIAVDRAPATPPRSCDCGHDHDPTELRVEEPTAPAGPCEHGGTDEACAHDCASCVFAGARTER